MPTFRLMSMGVTINQHIGLGQGTTLGDCRIHLAGTIGFPPHVFRFFFGAVDGPELVGDEVLLQNFEVQILENSIIHVTVEEQAAGRYTSE